LKEEVKRISNDESSFIHSIDRYFYLSENSDTKRRACEKINKKLALKLMSLYIDKIYHQMRFDQLLNIEP
jgi:hypothetical protein